MSKFLHDSDDVDAEDEAKAIATPWFSPKTVELKMVQLNNLCSEFSCIDLLSDMSKCYAIKRICHSLK